MAYAIIYTSQDGRRYEDSAAGQVGIIRTVDSVRAFRGATDIKVVPISDDPAVDLSKDVVTYVCDGDGNRDRPASHTVYGYMGAELGWVDPAPDGRSVRLFRSRRHYGRIGGFRFTRTMTDAAFDFYGSQT